MVDLLTLAIADGLLREAKWDVRVALYYEIEDFAFIWRRGAKGCDDEGCCERLGGCEELGRDIFLGLSGGQLIFQQLSRVIIPIPLCLCQYL